MGQMRHGDRYRRRRREMLEAYYETLQENGLQGASIGRIAKRLDTHPSLIIHYFGSKEQMTIELVDYLLEVYHETYGDKLAAIEDPLERIMGILDAFFSVEYQQLLPDNVFYACFYLSLCHPQVREAFETLNQAETSLLETTISACMTAGHLAQGDPSELAVAVEALEAGFAFLIAGSNQDELRKAIGESLKGQALKLLQVVDRRNADQAARWPELPRADSEEVVPTASQDAG